MSRTPGKAWWLVCLISVASIVLAPVSVFASEQDGRSNFKRDANTLLITGAYGAVGGAALGLASYPSTKSFSGVLIGSAVGLVLGLTVGVYHINHRDDPGNPLAQAEPKGSRQQTPLQAKAPLFEAQLVQLRF